MPKLYTRILGTLPSLFKKPVNGATTANRLLYGMSWQLVALPVTRLFTFLVAIVQARLLGKEGYGELGMALSTLTFFSLFATAAAGNTCTKFIAELRLTDRDRAQRICGISIQATVILSLIFSVISYLASPFIASSILHNTEITGLLTLSSAALVVQTIEGTFTGILYGFASFRSASFATSVQVVTWLPLTALLTPRWGAIGSLSAFTCSHAICAGLLFEAVRREMKAAQFKIPLRESWQEARVLWDYSLPMILHGVLCIPTVWATNAILARQPTGYVQLGAYNAAFQFRTAVIQIPMMLQSVAMPFFSELSGISDRERFVSLFDTLMRISWGVGLLAAIAVSLSAQPLMLMFGRDFRTDGSLLALVMAVSAVSLVSSLSGNALQANGMVWNALWANVAYAVTSIFLAWLLIPKFLGLGLAGAFVVSTSIQAFLLLAMLSRHMASARLITYASLSSLSSILISALSLSTPLIKILCTAIAAITVCIVGVPTLVTKLKSQLASAST